MSEEPKAKPEAKPAKDAARRARLSAALRANLLKRKEQARTKKASGHDGDEGRQG
jgi:hypothetical protein